MKLTLDNFSMNHVTPDSHLRVYLRPGEYYLAEKPTEVWTVLGSCLAIIFYNPRLQIGAIAHAQLAEQCIDNGNCSQQCSDFCPGPCYQQILDLNPYKYVSCSIRLMLEAFVQRGIFAHEIDIKLFGGASVLPLAHPVKSVGRSISRPPIKCSHDMSSSSDEKNMLAELQAQHSIFIRIPVRCIGNLTVLWH